MYICKQPGCGYVFPEGPSSKCPNCEKSPFGNEEEIRYSAEEMEGRKKMLGREYSRAL